MTNLPCSGYMSLISVGSLAIVCEKAVTLEDEEQESIKRSFN